VLQIKLLMENQRKKLCPFILWVVAFAEGEGGIIQVRGVELLLGNFPFETFACFMKLEVSLPFCSGFLIIFQTIPRNDFFAVFLFPHKQAEHS